MKVAPPKNVDEYIKSFPKETQKLLNQMRSLIKKHAPQSEECISYQMPSYKLHGMLVYFAGYEHHIGFYPGAGGIAQFQKQIAANYKWAKGSVQFPLDEVIPEKLVAAIVKFRVEQNLEKEKQRSQRICKNGHTYYKTSDCPTCPVCERERKPGTGFTASLSMPAIRALEGKKIKTLVQLSKFSESEIKALHGIGPSSIPKLKKALKAEGLAFKKG